MFHRLIHYFLLCAWNIVKCMHLFNNMASKNSKIKTLEQIPERKRIVSMLLHEAYDLICLSRAVNNITLQLFLTINCPTLLVLILYI